MCVYLHVCLPVCVSTCVCVQVGLAKRRKARGNVEDGLGKVGEQEEGEEEQQEEGELAMGAGGGAMSCSSF